MEVSRGLPAQRRRTLAAEALRQLPTPAALLPALALALLAGSFTLLEVAALEAWLARARQARDRAAELAARLATEASESPRRLARGLSRRLLPGSGGEARWPRNLVGCVAALASAGSLLRVLRSLRGSLALMNRPQRELEVDLKQQFAAVLRPAWGRGLPCAPQPGEWRPYLYTILYPIYDILYNLYYILYTLLYNTIQYNIL